MAGFPELMNQANLSLSGNQLESASAAYQQAAELDPSQAQAWYGLGLAELKLGRPGRAVAPLARAADLAPEFTPARELLKLASEQVRDATANSLLKGGVLKYRLGLWNEALEAFQLSLRVKPDSPNTWYNLGAAQYHLKRYEDADRSAREALRLSPGFAGARFLLGRVFEARGNMAAAVTLYSQVLSLPGAGAFGIQSRSRIEALNASPPQLPLHFYAKANFQGANTQAFLSDPSPYTHSLDASAYGRLSWDPRFFDTAFSAAYTNYYFRSSNVTGTAELDYHGFGLSARPPLGGAWYAGLQYDFAYAVNPGEAYYRHHLADLQLQSEGLGPSLVALELQRLWESYPAYSGLDSESLVLGASVTHHFGDAGYATLSLLYRDNRALAAIYSYSAPSAHFTLRLRPWKHLSPQLDLHWQGQYYPDWPLAQGGSGRQDRIATARLEITLLQFEHVGVGVGDELWQDDSNVEIYALRGNTAFCALSLSW